MARLINSSSSMNKQYSNLKANKNDTSFKVIGMRRIYCGAVMVVGIVEKDDAALFITKDPTLGLLVARDSEFYLDSLENYDEQTEIPEFSGVINLDFKTSNEYPENDFDKLEEIYDIVCLGTAYSRKRQ